MWDGKVNVCSKRCAHHGCTKKPSYGARTAEFCSRHERDGMVDVTNKKCAHHGCTKRTSYGMESTKTETSAPALPRTRWFASGASVATPVARGTRRTARKAPKRRCSALSMPRTVWWMSRAGGAPTTVAPSTRAMVLPGSKTVEFCSQHAKDGMVDVKSKRCAHPSCTKHARYGVEGTNARVFWSQHAREGMVDITSKRCAHPSCTKRRSYGVEGTNAVFCSQHAEDGMVNAKGRRRVSKKKVARSLPTTTA